MFVRNCYINICVSCSLKIRITGDLPSGWNAPWGRHFLSARSLPHGRQHRHGGTRTTSLSSKTFVTKFQPPIDLCIKALHKRHDLRRTFPPLLHFYILTASYVTKHFTFLKIPFTLPLPSPYPPPGPKPSLASWFPAGSAGIKALQSFR
jgi:hypothetical protein